MYRSNVIANIKGSNKYPNISGIIRFYEFPMGVLVVSEVSNLPVKRDNCINRLNAMHIHNGVSCDEKDDKYVDVGSHYNPNNCAHPMHLGDLLPLENNDSYAFSAVLYNKFTIEEIIGKVVIIHESYDDFTTQPSGNAGKMIACGLIEMNSKTSI